MRESKEGCGFGCVVRWGGSRRIWGMQNRNQNILYRKILFLIKKLINLNFL